MAKYNIQNYIIKDRQMEKDTFGDILKKYINESGFNIYQFSKATGINRVSLQRYITNKRFPSPDVFDVILKKLQLQFIEKEEFKKNYEIHNIGKPLYFQRLFIKNLIENFSKLNIDKSNEYPDFIIDFSKIPENSIFNIYTKPDIFNILFLEFKRTLQTKKKVSLSLFLPSELSSEYLNYMLTAVPATPKQEINITQIFSITKQSINSHETQNYNLKMLGACLPFCFSSQFFYQAYFYYGSYDEKTTIGLLFPYYVIFNDTVMILSSDLETAILCKSQLFVNSYKTEFYNHLIKCQIFVQTAGNYNDYYMQFLTKADYGEQEYWFKHQPCILSVANLELLNAFLCKDIDNREYILNLIKKRINKLPNSSENLYHFFTEKGLIEFIETGISTDLPPINTRIIPIPLRLSLIKKLKDVCKSDQQLLRIINHKNLKAPDCYFIQLANNQVNIINYTNSWKILSISETGIYYAFLDFISYLPTSQYVYSKDETLAILDKHISTLNSKLIN
jgi:transcriptional regulator with XRE-family HTH domain